MIKPRLPDFRGYSLLQKIRHPRYAYNLESSGLVPTLLPPPPSSPPEFCTHASALGFQLQLAPQYSRGICYVTDFDTNPSVLAQLKSKLEMVVPQAEFTKVQFDHDGVWV
jgi:hypothetical protein